MTTLCRAVAAPLACLAVGCAPQSARPTPEFGPVVQQGRPLSSVAAVAERRPGDQATDHVVVVSIDGLRPDAIARYRAPTLQRLIREGSHTLSAQTVAPSKTLPSHASMLTGVEPSVHGITWNSEQGSRGTVAVSTVFGVARSAGLATAAFFAKTKFSHLVVPGTLDHVRLPRFGLLGPWAAGHMLPQVDEYLSRSRPNLLFIHIAEPDAAGHVFGWMTPMYGSAVRAADSAVAHIVRRSDATFGPGRYTLVITADHGGHASSHGTEDARDTSIPWIVWGQQVNGGVTLRKGVRTMDTAATILWLLGLKTPESWTGRPVEEAFRSSPPAR